MCAHFWTRPKKTKENENPNDTILSFPTHDYRVSLAIHQRQQREGIITTHDLSVPAHDYGVSLAIHQRQEREREL